ncbi:MAG: nitroreductase family protein [Bacteroidales bacterium]|jgi:nitroreductase|nr:nitroreductase family protein [Bacteroidales bacterium]MBR6865058.1 nitroreductase family protein [Bacteroidales bacterium]
MKRIVTLCAFAALLLTGCARSQAPAAPTLDEVFASRRSIRAYQAGKTVSEAELRELFLATQNAPSWANQQPSKYYVALGDEKREAVLELIGGNKDRVVNASAFIVSTFEKGKSGFFRGNPVDATGDFWGAYDNGLSNAYLVLKARAMGFDTLIMGMRDADALRTLFSIPENEAVLAVIALGYRAQDPSTPAHRPLDEVVKFF